MEVRDSPGAVVYTHAVEREVVLRPTRGERKEDFSVSFDLPAGSYEARALLKVLRPIWQQRVTDPAPDVRFITTT